MHLRVVSPLLMLTLVAGVSCNQADTPSRPATLSEQAKIATASVPANPSPTARAAAPQASVPIPPKDAQWTLYCSSISGVNHVEQANQVKQQLLSATALRDWYVIHQENESVIYYGFYRSWNDPKDAKESARAQQERKDVMALTDRMGDRVFGRAMFVGVDAPDPVAPPEWNLMNAKGYWSLQIAAYKDSPQRKQAAVEAVRDAQARGIEAYYYHGTTSSSVCLGAFPREALKEQEASVAESSDPTQPILVLPQPLPFNATDVHTRDTGESVRTVVPRIEPQDPKLIELWRQYPEHSVNGEVQYKVVRDQKGATQRIPDQSFLVVIPKPAPSLLTNGTSAAPEATVRSEPPPQQQPLPPTLTTPAPPPSPKTTGKLKSIQD